MGYENHRTSSIARAVRLACLIGASGVSATAMADTITPVQNGGYLNLSQSFASTAPGQMPSMVIGTGANDGMGTVVGSDLTDNGSSTYLFDQSYSGSAGSFSAGTLGNGNSFGLVSSYVVALPTSSTGAFAFSLNLSSSTGIDDLSARLYSYGPNQNTTLGITGAPPNGGVVDPWSASINGGPVASTSLAAANVSAGLYVLELVGQLSPGATSGSYSGQLSVTPVPLPASLPLLLGTMAGFAAMIRRRRATPCANAAHV